MVHTKTLQTPTPCAPQGCRERSPRTKGAPKNTRIRKVPEKCSQQWGLHNRRSTHPLDTRPKVHLFLPLAIFLHSSGKGAWSAPRGRRRVRTRAISHTPCRRRLFRSAPPAHSTHAGLGELVFQTARGEGCGVAVRESRRMRGSQTSFWTRASFLRTRRRHTQSLLAPPRAPLPRCLERLSEGQQRRARIKAHARGRTSSTCHGEAFRAVELRGLFTPPEGTCVRTAPKVLGTTCVGEQSRVRESRLMRGAERLLFMPAGGNEAFFADTLLFRRPEKPPPPPY